MQYKEVILSLDQIDENDITYRITTNTQVEDLTTSIWEVGLLNAPIVEQRENCFKILSGFRRIAACHLLNIDRVKIRCVSSEVPQPDRAKIAIAENSSQRALNLIETSRALNLLDRFIDDAAVFQTVASKLALSENPNMIDNLMPLSSLSDSIQNAILSGTIGLPVALHLGNMEEFVASLLVNMFNKLKFGLNKQREVILLSEEIAYREDISLKEVLQDPYIKGIMNDGEKDRAQLGRELRRYLRRRRFPEISHAESMFESERKMLKLDHQIRLHPPTHFESETYSFHIEFRTLEEYLKRLESLNRLVDHPSFRKILTRS